MDITNNTNNTRIINSTENRPIPIPSPSPEDRIKNADRLAKSLKTYLTESPIKKPRRGGFPKDPRITQLNAAYKYIIHLEDKLTDICRVHNSPISEDCTLLHTTNNRLNNLSYRNRLENSDMTPQTPTHGMEALEGSKPMCSSSSSSGINMPLNNLRGFENLIDASPILGSENHFFGDVENFTEFESSLKTSKTSNSRKRKLLNPTLMSNSILSGEVDMNNNEITTNTTTNNKENQNNQTQLYSKPGSSRSLKTPDSGCHNLNDEDGTSIGGKRYFLRSTTKLKNMLMANNTVVTPPAVVSKRLTNSKKRSLKGLDSSMCSSTRSTSMATTPSVSNPNSNMSTTSSNEFDTIDPNNLIKLSLSQEQITQLYNESSNQLESLNSKNPFHFV